MDVPLRVLLVEDVAADAQLVRLAFDEAAVSVDLRHVTDGREALEALRNLPEADSGALPQLVLLDLNMPRMDGREFLRAVKDDPDLRSLPVVVLTTSDAEADIATAYRLGAAGYIVKPMDMDDLTDHMGGLVRYWGAIVRLPST